MAAESKRIATLQLNNKEHPTMLRVQLPPKITQAELTKLINGVLPASLCKVT
ncbi:MAG: hypothetical protein ABI833_11720 [Acidobacteriota bacterium]